MRTLNKVSLYMGIIYYTALLYGTMLLEKTVLLSRCLMEPNMLFQHVCDFSRKMQHF